VLSRPVYVLYFWRRWGYLDHFTFRVTKRYLTNLVRDALSGTGNAILVNTNLLMQVQQCCATFHLFVIRIVIVVTIWPFCPSIFFVCENCRNKTYLLSQSNILLLHVELQASTGIRFLSPTCIFSYWFGAFSMRISHIFIILRKICLLLKTN